MNSEGTQGGSNGLSVPVADPAMSPPKGQPGARRTRGHHLPVNPASMLVEPFVEHLAAALRRSMDAAMVRCDAGYSSEAKNL
jgi:hypothetical protein